jgi:hypothetical protein
VAAWQEQTLGAPQWAQYELKERVRCFSAGLRALLPSDYGQAVGILAEAARRLTETEGEKLAFEYMFLPDYVECYDIEHPDVSIGGRLDFSFSLANRSRQAANIRLEYAIHYLTSTGKVSRKVFQIKEFPLAPDAEARFSRSQRFQEGAPG